jgi:hypothetical protein
VGAYIVLAGVVIFFALTRTEVGRNHIRQQIQSAFNERFAGTLQIGALQGTLLNDLSATNVILRDEQGAVVAAIDSVHTQPRWNDVLTAQVSARNLTLIRPHLKLHRRADGRWNVQRALSRTAPSSGGGDPLDLSFSQITVRDGRVTTRRDGEPPAPVQDRWLFDYTESTLDRLDAEATVEWTDTERLVDLDALSFRLPEQNLSGRAKGQVARTRSQWSLNALTFQLGQTRLSAGGTLQPAPSDTSRTVVDLQLAESHLHYDELQRLAPRLPLRKAVTVEGRMGGSVNRIVVNELQMTHDASTVRLEGTAFGLPDSLDLEAQLLTSRVRPSDLKDVWPTAPLGTIEAIGPVRVGASVDGLVAWRDTPSTAFDLDGTFSAQGRPGAVRGSLSVERAATGPLRYTGTAQTDSLNLAPLTGAPRLESRLTGRAAISGRGTRLRTLQSELDLQLSEGRLAGRRFAAADLQLDVDGRNAQGTVDLRQPLGGRLTLRGEVDATGPTPIYTLATTARDFDLRGAHPTLPNSRLNAVLTTQGRGDSGRTLSGSALLAVDSSYVRRADSTVQLPPHEVSLTLAPPASGAPRVRLGGTLASATVEGDVFASSLWTSARLWATSLRRALDQRLTPLPPVPPDSAKTAPAPPLLLGRIQDTLQQAAPASPLQLRGKLAVHRMDLVRRWWAGAPDRADSLRAQAALTLGPDTLHTSGSLTADRLQLGPRRADTLRTSYELSGRPHSRPLDSLSAAATLAADTLYLGTRALTAPSLSVALIQGRGSVEAEAVQFGRTGPFSLQSGLAIQDNRAQLTIRNLSVGTGPHTWTSTSGGAVSIYADAITFDSINVDAQRPLADGTQRIGLHGTLSAAETDTLYAEMSDVLLHPIAQLAGLSRPLGGRLNGEVALAGGWSQPQAEGAFEVHRLSLDRRILGTLQVQSRFAPNAPDLLLNASLAPPAPSLDSLSGPDLVPRGARTLEENRLQLRGRVRLPGVNGATASPETDQLDLNVNVDRADLFFFKYIFDENLAKARGYTAGTIHIGGRFRRPIFDAELNIRNGRFTLPQFGLAYSASGPVRVDRRGIHTDNLTVTDASGSATVQGSVLFNEYKFFSFDLSAELDELAIIDVADGQDLPFYGQIRASGPVSLTGPLPNATLRSDRARTTPDSELFIPVSEGGVEAGTGFIIFADSTGQIPNLEDLTQRDNILADRPAGEPSFLEGLEIDINVSAPEESTVNLVFDPVVGDVVTAVGSGRVQLQRQGGDFFVYGNFDVTDGTYLFTAGEVFVRRFDISGGTLTWDGPPTNAQLDIQAEYRTRASTAGLPGYEDGGRIPVRVLLDIGGRVETPRVDLQLARVRDERDNFLGSETLDALLNRPDRTTEYATSVLLTNTFLLTTESFTQGRSAGADGSSGGSLTAAGNQLAFNSVSQLVASQLNRYLGAALPNVDLNFGLQGEDPNDLDVIYGVALRLLNERLVIRGEGVYTGDDPGRRQPQGPQGEFVVELRLSSRVSVEAFYRRTGDELTRNQTLTSSTGAGLSYQTEFATWRELFDRLFGWLLPDEEPPSDEESPDREADPEPAPVARSPSETGTDTDDSDENGSTDT